MEIKLPATTVPIGPIQLSRQQLRQLGRKEAEIRVRGVLMHKDQPVLSRKERRQLVRQAHKHAWDARNKELVSRVYRGIAKDNEPVS